ncbi:amino acid ABC transporter permease [Olsenella sp. An290]|uniref:amino acid ABC transporter permease n=1 Tax=Olsenella sp. An290 TaxID=1965625 RepID=UPI000B39C795|nr:amino acid ABC transporter permease [Olsenella sp. An290]OUO34234.1 hypothetical protein B5F84_07205 [Olsenella sp. An290]
MQHRRGALLVALALALSGVFATVVPQPAQALTTEKATARPNEDGGDGVIGGMDTRLTWEGTVEPGEEVTSVTLTLPEGSTFEGSTTRITALEGLKRMDVTGEAVPSGSSITVSFDQAIPEGSLLRLEITNMQFPSAGGECTVTGTYEAAGATHELAPSDPISTIANTPLQSMVNWLDEQPWVEAWNSNQFLGMFLKPQLLLTSFASLAPGWLLCLGIVVAAYPFAIAIGLVFAMLKISRWRVVRAVAVTYINVLRGTPLFLQIYIMFFGLPMLNINIDNNLLGIIVVAINSSAYLAEIFRAGIQSIPQGQYEAASSLGMNYVQTMLTVILPQTVRRVIPTVTSDFITAFKDTSLLSSVGVMELMMFSKNLTTVTGNITPYVAAGIFYLIVTLPLIKVVSVIEENIARSERGAGPRPKRRAQIADNADELVGQAAKKDGVAAEVSAVAAPTASLAPASAKEVATDVC